MGKTTSVDDIRDLASRLREIAETTVMPEYARLMASAALELEHRASLLEARASRSNAHSLMGGLTLASRAGSA